MRSKFGPYWIANTTQALAFILLLVGGSQAVAGGETCADLFRSRSFVASYFARQRLVQAASSRTVKSADSSTASGAGLGSGKWRRSVLDVTKPVAAEMTSDYLDRVMRQTGRPRLLAENALFRFKDMFYSESKLMGMRSITLPSAVQMAFSDSGSTRFAGFSRFFLVHGGERTRVAADAVVLLGEILNVIREDSYHPNVAKVVESADVWVDDLMKIAQTDPRARRTLTAGLVLHTFESRLESDQLWSPDAATKARWFKEVRDVARRIVLPKIKDDFRSGVAFSDRALREFYVETVEQILATAADPHATMFFSSRANAMKPVQTRMLNDALSVVRFDYGAIVVENLQHELRTSLRDPLREPHDRLFRSIVKYHLWKVSDFRPRFSLAELIQYSRDRIGDRELEETFLTFVKELERLDYNETMVIDGLNLIHLLDP